ncbi:hypothetical protein [Streptomyces marianii]|uniref:Uncharacterized protein n=1 Tax=Streptomyces marianii TaxID=1817406 RepID=A0A5R9E509_9ACTN|nr:hypothetical protein [Streptomyces marianii]TLQ43354.1 hypothetical protein FEF34_09570 [Streptomyces marianii]
MSQKTTSPAIPAKPLIVLGVCLALLGGIGSWLFFGRETAIPCNGLPDNKRVQKSLGAAMQPGMSCTAVGDAIVKATTGSEPGRHTQPQTQALKDVLFALGLADSDDLTLDPALRVPLATALADYAPDVHEMLAGLDSDYVINADETDPPWEEGGTYHLAVYNTFFRDIVRAIAQDPQAYATLRMAETRYGAQQLAAVPTGASGYSLSLPPTANARAFGILDGIADAVYRSQDTQQAQKWRSTVWDLLLNEQAAPRAYQDDPVGHLTATWLHELRNTPKDDRPDRLRTQGVDMARAWLQARNADEQTQKGLLAKVERSALSAYREIKP